MSTTTEHGATGHDPHLAHHFDTPMQQRESAALGMWIFLATEILLFGGLFCAYGVYRANHPEIFEYAHRFLSTPLGAVNTVILLCSSFTMATAVWAAHAGRARLLPVMLVLTLLGGAGFLGIKYVEYEHKWKDGLLWGRHYRPETHGEPHGAGTQPTGPSATGSAPGAAAAGGTQPATTPAAQTQPDPAWVFQPAASGPRGLLLPGREPEGHAAPRDVRNVQTFFAVYFAMTGLHALHVIAGLVVIAWILARSLRGHFGPAYSTPVHMVGLYWHVVDIVWIYLFPLLYLIH